MKKDYIWLKMMAGYILLLLLMIMSSTANGQSPCGNDELWVGELGDCETSFIDIGTDSKAAGKYKIVVIPTILIFNGEEEVARYQANIMMQMESTQKEIQGKIDEIIMEAF